VIDAAKDANVSIRFGLGVERVEQSFKEEQRSGRYVSGQALKPNPKIPDLKKEIAGLDKEVKWQRSPSTAR
jgi:hypothetical protein